jgi:hypothetical protein
MGMQLMPVAVPLLLLLGCGGAGGFAGFVRAACRWCQLQAPLLAASNLCSAVQLQSIAQTAQMFKARCSCSAVGVHSIAAAQAAGVWEADDSGGLDSDWGMPWQQLSNNRVKEVTEVRVLSAHIEWRWVLCMRNDVCPGMLHACSMGTLCVHSLGQTRGGTHKNRRQPG